MEKIILHIDMDAFFAAIEERDNPQFRGQPIVVGADPKKGYGRGVVSTANYQARKYGIHSALPISKAFRLCPKAIFLPVNIKRYAKVSNEIMRVIKTFADKIEQVSIDECYIELINPNYEQAEKVAREIKSEIWQTQKLTCSIGIGPNKLIAKIASNHQKPNGLTIVKPEEVLSFLDPKPARSIPGIGPKTFETLQKLNVRTIKDLRQISKEKLMELFGKNGSMMWTMARGLDERTIEEFRKIKSVGRQITFEYDTNSPKLLIETILNLLLEVFEELKERNLFGKTVTITVRYQSFETHTSSKKAKEVLTFERARQLAIKLLLEYLSKNRKVRLVGVRISDF